MRISRFIFLLSIALFVSFNVNAQTEAGKVLIGGDTRFITSSTNVNWGTDEDNEDTGRKTNFGISPLIGCFVANNFAIGVEVPISILIEKDGHGREYSSTSMSFAPFAKYYFGSSNVKPYLNSKIGVGSLRVVENSNYSSYYDDRATIFLYRISGGVAIFLNESVSIDIGAGYQSTKLKVLDDYNKEYRNISSGFDFSIGFIFTP